MIGTTLSHYKITAKLGQGGMGEVFRATDTKLNRDVAIKVLPESFANNKERLARFDREAKALASLNHPNIAGIFGVEQEGDIHALVMELVEGEDLSTRIKRGPLPVEEALDVCKQIAEALEAAHEKGIIHRDLKPANVKLTEDGKIKVLDFGLAKATATESSATSTTDSLSPTITADYTMPGTLLGTAAYMSPEQARGKPVDKRSDIWSFGCVLYECLTGKRLFKGEDTTETLAKILESEPDWAALPENTPPTVHLLLRKCLAKDRKRRLRDSGDAIVDLEQAIADPSSSFIRLSDEALQETRGGSGIQRPVFVSAILIVALLTAAFVWFLKPVPVVTLPSTPPPAPIRVLDVDLGFQGSINSGAGVGAKLSPDGSRLAFIGTLIEGTGLRQLFIKSLYKRGEPSPLTAADGISDFSFSPDGNEIIFKKDHDTQLLKVSVTGGATALPLCDSGYTVGIHWAEDGFIVFGNRGSTNGIMRVSSGGDGVPEPLTSPKAGETGHYFPQLLPADNLLLFTARSGRSNYDVMVQRLDQKGQHEILVNRVSHARYIQSTGHLLFLKGNSIVAASFDPNSLQIGEHVSVLNDVVSTSVYGAGQFHFSEQEGSLVYLTSISSPSYQLNWIDRTGNLTSLTNLIPGDIGVFRLSPDGEKLAYDLHNGTQSDIWIHNIELGSRQKMTTHPSHDFTPLWSPDGETVVFTSDRHGPNNLYWRRADLDGRLQRLTDSPNNQHAISWHTNSQHIALRERAPGTTHDIRILNLERDGQSGWIETRTTNFLATPAAEWFASFSRDGKWLAYQSDVSGQPQVYVRPFNRSGRPVTISVEGLSSGYPLWSRTTNKLYFSTREDLNSRESQVYVTSYEEKDGLFIPDPEGPKKWPGGTLNQRESRSSYDLHPDGQRLLVRKLADVEGDENQSLNKVVHFQNFDEHLREKVPTGKK